MRAKKSLGQNFLKSHAIAKEIATAVPVSKSDRILEVGPGKGMLTKELLALPAQTIAIEKDDRLIPELEEQFSGEIAQGKFQVVHGDVLHINPKSLGLSALQYVVIANIPYYITGALLRHFLENETPPRALVLMVQKEVADRIVARDGKESILSISVKAYGTPRYIKKVPARFFSPQPKIDSAIIAIEGIRSGFSSAKEHEEFFSLMKKGFSHKRKTLLGNLKKDYAVSTDTLRECNIPESVRAEDITLSDWKCLLKKLHESQ